MTTLKANEEIGNLEKKEVIFFEKRAKVLQRRQKENLAVLRDIPKNVLEKTVNVDKVLCNFKTHSITNTNELFTYTHNYILIIFYTHEASCV